MLIFELVSESEESVRRVAARPGATWPRFLRKAWEEASAEPSHESHVPGRGRAE